MYLKSLKIKNFRKFGDNNNIVEFVKSNHQSKEQNIATSTTLIVGKNNSGKTTVTEAIKRLYGSNKFSANDFNFIYLNKLLNAYKKSDDDNSPCIEFEVTIRINFNSDRDYVTNIAPFMSIGDVQSSVKESDFKVILKYELKEAQTFNNEVKVLFKEYTVESILEAYDFECDHCFGFYSDIEHKRGIAPDEVYELFVDIDGESMHDLLRV